MMPQYRIPTKSSKTDLQNVVMDKLYAQLKAGSLTGHESTWQMAVAMAIGKVKDKFKR